MGNYFEMQKYQAPYIEASHELDRLKVRIEGLRSKMIYGGDPEDAMKELQAAEAQLPELEEKVAELWSLYTTGHSRKELAAPEPRKSPFGPFNPGHTGNPVRRLPQ